jgi:monofunctional biosynthetic peptidoglycan transglycosylase
MKKKARFLILGGGAIVLAAGAAWIYLTLPDVRPLKKQNPKTTALLEARREEARRKGSAFKPQQTWLPLSRISPHLHLAVVVAEDAGFYGHRGFDMEEMREALKENWEAKRFVRGASTITQQLAKNLYLSTAKTPWRKIQEAWITVRLERDLPKSRILELYLNVVEWGEGVFGAEAAARHYFGKPAGDLSAEEAAWLAAILPAPRRYDARGTTRHLEWKQRIILRRMEQRAAASPRRALLREPSR